MSITELATMRITSDVKPGETSGEYLARMITKTFGERETEMALTAIRDRARLALIAEDAGREDDSVRFGRQAKQDFHALWLRTDARRAIAA